MKLLRDADEFSVDERRLYRLAWVGKGRNLEQNLVSKSQPDSWNNQIPIDSLNGHVFAGGSRLDRVPFPLE
jgi:hypothetical protein